METTPTEAARLSELEDIIGYRFKDRDHLRQALMHKSYVNEQGANDLQSNERLEFLGDAVLEFIVTKILYDTFPDDGEGVLTMRRARLVDRNACAKFSRRLSLGKHIYLGRGEELSGGRQRKSILANSFESLVAAVYLDSNLRVAKRFVSKQMRKDLAEIEKVPAANYKAELQDYSQRQFQEVPLYETISESGPDHAKMFRISVTVNGTLVGTGQGESKKLAQQRAAQAALEKIEKEGLDIL